MMNNLCRIVPTIAFMVRWDEEKRKYLALDTCGSVLSASSDKCQTIESARREARLTSQSGVRVTIIVKEDDGNFSNEWVAEPPTAG